MSTKPVTINELKTFIDAVEFASDSDNWVPSDRQWKRIRDMINRLEEAAPPAPMQMPAAPFIPPQGSFGPPPVATQSAMQLPQGNWSPPPPQQLSGPFATGGPSPVKTPDIDTTHGKGYQSSFA